MELGGEFQDIVLAEQDMAEKQLSMNRGRR